MGWMVALGVLILLAGIPLGISAIYNVEGPLLRVIFGPVRLQLFPRPKREKKAVKQAPIPRAEEKKADLTLPQPPKPPKKEASPSEEKEKGGCLLDFLPLVKVALDFLGDFRRKLRVSRLEIKVIMAGGDPCDLAVNYGRAWAAVGGLLPQLERLFVIKDRNIEVACDFCADETKIIARLDLTITLGRILQLAVWYGIRAFREFLIIQKKRKGGAVT